MGVLKDRVHWFCGRETKSTAGHPLTVVQSVAVALVILACAGGGEDQDTGGELKSRLDKLRSVPYTSVTEDLVSGDSAGVLLHDGDRSYPGYNLYCAWVEPKAFLLDMEGNVVHEWTYSANGRKGFFHAILAENGDLVVIVRYRWLLRLDRNSQLVWKQSIPVHHEVTEAPDGTFYVALREMSRHRGLAVRFAAIAHLTSEGKMISKWSTYDHLDEIKQAFDQSAFLDTVLDSLAAIGLDVSDLDTLQMRVEVKQELGRDIYDYFHLNTISVLPETPISAHDRTFAPGNLLICFRNVNQIAILDKETMEILWVWGQGELEWPHHPTMLKNGNILVFDNGVEKGYSRILELDPVSEVIVWEYVADPPSDFFTRFKGSCQRLPNGNTLCCESERGRCFEVTPEGDVVWGWINPAIKKGRRVQVYRMMRYPTGWIDSILDR